MKTLRCMIYIIGFISIGYMSSCSTGDNATTARLTPLKTYPMDEMGDILTTSGVAIDREVSSDGRGSLRVTTETPQTIRLFETGDLDIEEARLIYQAKIRTEDIDGDVYLEMWCHFPGKGEYFSRALHQSLTGSVDWTSQETPFFLKRGENPDNVKLNLVINGKGTAWIDDVRLVKGSLY